MPFQRRCAGQRAEPDEGTKWWNGKWQHSNWRIRSGKVEGSDGSEEKRASWLLGNGNGKDAGSQRKSSEKIKKETPQMCPAHKKLTINLCRKKWIWAAAHAGSRSKWILKWITTTHKNAETQPKMFFCQIETFSFYYYYFCTQRVESSQSSTCYYSKKLYFRKLVFISF